MPNRTPPSRSTDPALRILLVEDLSDDEHMLRQHLVVSGLEFSMTWARSRDQFLASLTAEFDLVIADHRLPDMDSLDAIALLREHGRDIPLIVLTGSLDEELVVRTLRGGAADVVIKDRLARLVPAVRRVMADHRLARQAQLATLRFEAIFAHSPDAILISAGGRLELINEVGLRLLGLARPLAAGMPVARFLPEIDRLLPSDPDDAGIRHAAVLETWVEDASGRRLDVELTFCRLKTAERVEWQLILRDISRRKLMLEELHLFQRAIAATGNGVLITDPRQSDDPIIFANPAAERITGYAPAEMLGRNCRFLQGGDRDQPDLGRVRAALLAGRSCTAVLRNRRKDGSEFWNELFLSPIRDAAGTITNHIGILNDVTDAREAQIRVILSEQRYRLLIELSPVAVFIQSASRFVYANPAGHRLLGTTDEEFAAGRAVADFITSGRLDAAAGAAAGASGGAVSGSLPEQEWRRSDGTTFHVEVMTTPTQHGGQAASLLMVRDIGLRRAAERALRKAHAEAELLLSSISAVLIGLRPDNRISRWNEAAERTFGIPAGTALGNSLAASGLGPSCEPVMAAIAVCRVAHGQAELVDVRYDHASGRRGFLTITILANTADSGPAQDAAEILLLGIETTARKNLEAERNHGQKLESIGQLAAGIAHEINTPIQFIGDNLRFLRDSFADLDAAMRLQQGALGAGDDRVLDPGAAALAAAAWAAADLPYLCTEIPRALEQSSEGVTRVAGIVKAMKEFSHPGQEGCQPADLNHAIETTLTVARNEYKYVAEVRTDLDPALPAVSCFIGELNQVFLNLLVNAAHAIGAARGDGSKGLITISTRRLGEVVELRFQDDGTGIPAAARAKIFDPFFTTKPVGKGTGQGLYICHTIVVQRHRGTIAFETAEGVGTTFIITLPLIQPQGG
ncbi:MAG: PAS domain S-box protein [Planctomycetes bacterium]|nr:PAS domain S-box protein [Planctomycetota bacterium]